MIQNSNLILYSEVSLHDIVTIVMAAGQHNIDNVMTSECMSNLNPSFMGGTRHCRSAVWL